jgi:hypothetical protein
MGSFFILGGLAFALAGGLAYYFLNKNEEDKVEKKHLTKEQATHVQVEKILI